jgi:hypothetical protein
MRRIDDMKLSKKGRARQRAIHRAVSSGKALGGLLIGLAATVAGCREHRTPADTMGAYPAPDRQEKKAAVETNRPCPPPGMVRTMGIVARPPARPRPGESNDKEPKRGVPRK